MKFTELNVMFQSSGASIHCLHTKLQTVYKDFLSCFMCEASWRNVPNLEKIDPTSQTHHLPLNTMYMGAHVSLCLSQDVYKERSRHQDIGHFLRCVKEFYIESALQIKKRFPLGDPVIKLLKSLDPSVSFSEIPSIVPLGARFSNIVPQENLQSLDSEFLFHLKNLIWNQKCSGDARHNF
jgi:hypothetical protein